MIDCTPPDFAANPLRFFTMGGHVSGRGLPWAVSIRWPVEIFDADEPAARAPITRPMPTTSEMDKADQH